jgi:hypothetical protein
MRHAEYQRLAWKGKSILDLIGQPEDGADFDFEPPKLGKLTKDVDFG